MDCNHKITVTIDSTLNVLRSFANPNTKNTSRYS